MRSIEVDGDSIDEAIEQALRALEVARDRVEIEILSDASRGLFGIGGKKARVRATIRARVSLGLGEIEEPQGEAVPQETLPGSFPPLDGAVADRARLFLDGLLARLGVPYEVHPGGTDGMGRLCLSVRGDGSGFLIGRRGQTLDAIEYLINRILGRDGEGAQPRIALDVDGYRERRLGFLEELAHRQAEQAAKSGRAVVLNALSPRDRRVVHLALQGRPGIATRSEGQGYYRKLVIIPGEPSGPGRDPATGRSKTGS